jgi:FkbM family methyltransferase
LVGALKELQLKHANGSFPFYLRAATSDEVVAQQIFINQDYSLEDFHLNAQINQFAAAKVSQGMRPLIVDLGANIGAAVRWFLCIYPDARVIAVEPDETNFELLVRNTAGFDVVNIMGAIASDKGHAKLVDPGLGHFGFRTEIKNDGQIETFTVPELLEQYGGQSFFPLIVKIDIEGAEEELFSQNVEWVDAFPVLIIELHDWLLPGSNSSKNFLQCVAPRSRDFLYARENVFSIRTPIG